MDPEIDKRLRAIELKLNDTYTIVYKLRRAQRTASLMKAFYWLIIIGLTIAAGYLIKPYLTQLGEAYGLSHDEATSATQKSNTGNYSDLLKQVQQFQKDNQ